MIRNIYSIATFLKSWATLAIFTFVSTFLCLQLYSGNSHAWVETRVIRDDVRVTLERNLSARIEHKLIIRVAGGPLRTFEVQGVDADARPESDGYVVALKESAISTNSDLPALSSAIPIATEVVKQDVSAPTRTALRIVFGDSGIERGVYAIVFKYQTDFGRSGVIRPDGSMRILRWQGPSWGDGLDVSRAIFSLPSAPTEPMVLSVDTNLSGESVPFLSSVRQGLERDEIELMKPYAPKAEPIIWTFRLDARAVDDPSIQMSTPEQAHETRFESKNTKKTLWFISASIGLVAFSLLVALKFRQTARLGALHDVTFLPLIPIPLVVRSILSAWMLIGGLVVQLLYEKYTWGAVLVLGTTLLCLHKHVVWKPVSRKPGQWFPVSLADALRLPPPSTLSWIDISNGRGRLIFAMFVLSLCAVMVIVGRHSPHWIYVSLFNFVPILALFGTGNEREVPPDPAVAPIRYFRKMVAKFQKMQGNLEAKMVGRLRVPHGSPDADELRLLVIPKNALPGFRSIELGCVYFEGARGFIGLPEILLRCSEGSECEIKMQKLGCACRVYRGRRSGEVVFAFAPRLPTVTMTTKMLISLVRMLRVKQLPKVQHVERVHQKAA